MVADHYWATSYALTANDLYHKWNYKDKLKLDFSKIPYKYETNRQRFFSIVFKYFFYLLVKDIIENKVCFKLPKTTKAYIEMIPTTGEDFIKCRQNGKFQDIDFLVSNFTGYDIGLRFITRYGKWIKLMHVTQKYKDRITQLTNAGHGW